MTTIFVRQGHYATDPKLLASYPAADISIERIGDLLQYGLPEFLNAKLVSDPAGNKKRAY